ncbi:LacI family DNA-binding transcriptional regulator [Puniceicoccus vermicola]|uniref:LacI family DNA-binding transcriptional regulator n=1 Tax=Puniceicoccus vermicola TaxID=388746 RepID=A0A7X1AUH5_9BACT|nr:LacI family DNA-binding transcriptional regulator [Puniceicoccus vermicola]MBC2600241.1 LacI family DNA-binding transcriptional regulator [Puniceicoccus vermicola]
MGTVRKYTQKDIAKEANVHPSTVSLAMSNSPSLAKATRERIQTIAKKMGYQPDPFLSQLATYKHHGHDGIFRGTIAFLINRNPAEKTPNLRPYKKYLTGATKKAETYGYQLKVFDLDREKVSGSRLRQIMLARGVKGILLCPQPRGIERIDDFDFDDFSCVSFGYSLRSPRFHVVNSHQFHAAMLCMKKLIEAGCQRIGFAVPPFHDSRVDHNYLAGYLTNLSQNPQLPILPPFTGDSFSQRSFTEWFNQNKPDGLLTVPYRIPEFLKSMQVDTKLNCKVAITTLNESTNDWPGIDEDGESIAASAVDLIVSMIRRGEMGIPSKPASILLEGTWVGNESFGSNMDTSSDPSCSSPSKEKPKRKRNQIRKTKAT